MSTRKDLQNLCVTSKIGSLSIELLETKVHTYIYMYVKYVCKVWSHILNSLLAILA